MEDNYYIDLKKFSITEYEKELEEAELLPSRKILQEDIKTRFDCLRKQGMECLDDLLTALKTPDKLKMFAQKSGLSEEYLIMLKREISSNQPKPVNLVDFPGIAPDVIEKLAKHGMTNTKQLFNFVKTPSDRQNLSQKTGIAEEKILELTKLTDVTRIRWVGANFARLLVDSKWDTVEKVIRADYKEVYDELMRILEEKKYFKGKFGVNDMKICVLAAKIVPTAIEY